MWYITVACLQMRTVATSCTVFIDCGRLLLVGLSNICCCFGIVLFYYFFFRRGRKKVLKGEDEKKGKMRKTDLLSYKNNSIMSESVFEKSV